MERIFFKLIIIGLIIIRRRRRTRTRTRREEFLSTAKVMGHQIELIGLVGDISNVCIMVIR